MSQESERLRATLDALHLQLQSVDRVDPDVRALLESAVEDIHQTIDPEADPVETAEEDDSIVHRLTAAARHFEESHPTLSGAVTSVIEALGRMGI
jgi:hypothetical protein